MEDAWGRETTGLVVVHFRASQKEESEQLTRGRGRDETRRRLCVYVCVCVTRLMVNSSEVGQEGKAGNFFHNI